MKLWYFCPLKNYQGCTIVNVFVFDKLNLNTNDVVMRGQVHNEETVLSIIETSPYKSDPRFPPYI